jgi:hypothetical protein
LDVVTFVDGSDLPEIGGGERDGKSRNPAIALPEVACPLGERFVFPPAHGVSRRGFQEAAYGARRCRLP